MSVIVSVCLVENKNEKSHDGNMIGPDFLVKYSYNNHDFDKSLANKIYGNKNYCAVINSIQKMINITSDVWMRVLHNLVLGQSKHNLYYVFIQNQKKTENKFPNGIDDFYN